MSMLAVLSSHRQRVAREEASHGFGHALGIHHLEPMRGARQHEWLRLRYLLPQQFVPVNEERCALCPEHGERRLRNTARYVLAELPFL